MKITFKGIDETLQALDKLVDNDAISQGLNEVADHAVATAKKKLSQNTFYSYPQNLENSIIKKKIDDTEYEVEADGGVASYVEYGTGIVGKGNPHPDAPKDWIYDANSHGTAGWWYPTDTQPPLGQPQRFDQQTNKWYAWTQGLPSRPFMHETADHIEHIAKQVVESVLTRRKNEKPQGVDDNG